MAYRSVKQLIRRAEVITLPGSATVREASRLMAEHHIGAVLIVADGELEGIFTERDALNKVLAQEKDPAPIRAGPRDRPARAWRGRHWHGVRASVTL